MLLRRQVWRVVLYTIAAGAVLSTVAFALAFWLAR